MVGSVRIFARPWEALNLALPVVILAIGLIAGSQGYFRVPADFSFSISFFMAFISLGTLHTAFTVVMFYLPEVRSWSRDQFQAKGRRVILATSIALALFLLYFSSSGYLLGPMGPESIRDSGWHLFLTRLLMGIHAGVLHYHAITQSFGLSILYNHRLLEQGDLSAEEKQSVARLERWERRAFRVLIPLTTVLLAWVFVAPEQLHLALCASVTFTLAAFLFGLSLLYPRALRSNKWIFQLRLFLIPLTFYSYWGLFGVNCVHGFEYGMVFLQMRKNSGHPDRAFVWRLTALALFVFGIFAYARPEFTVHGAYSYLPAGVVLLLASASFATTFAHIYFDSKMFHFSDPITRKHISPLLR